LEQYKYPLKLPILSMSHLKLLKNVNVSLRPTKKQK